MPRFETPLVLFRKMGCRLQTQKRRGRGFPTSPPNRAQPPIFTARPPDMPSADVKWAHLGSNQGPTGYEPVALPTELWAHQQCSPYL
jgi:hypothetical protein